MFLFTYFMEASTVFYLLQIEIPSFDRDVPLYQEFSKLNAMPASRLLKMFGDHSSNAHMNCKLKEKWLTAGFAETTCLSTVLFHISFPSPYTRTQASSCPVLAIGGHSFIKALSYTRHRLLKRYWRDLKIHLVLLTTDLRVANCSVLRYKIST